MAVINVSCKKVKGNPHCPHGPTFKFVRMQDGCEQRFFACSAYRDRKDCGFYLADGHKMTQDVQHVWALEKEKLLPAVDHLAMEKRLQEVKEMGPLDRLYCHSCSELDVVSRQGNHSGHIVQTNISDTSLTQPSQILKPKEGSKKEAQFLFSSSTTQVIMENLRRAGVSRVLCLGTPRVHEHIQALPGNMQSLLLDMDHRYHSFWTSEEFVWYNMFNRHILSACADVPKHTLREFLSTDERVALVMDPPFGGHIEPLVVTVNHFSRRLAKNHKNNQLYVIWAFPYFRERHIIEKCPSITMLDYKVEYDNHKEFNNGSRGRKLGSPVRLYTNIKPKKFLLPKSEGYRFCNICTRWVAAENKHCTKCNACPSKDGRTYVHCDVCGSCVKPQWQHCFTCNRCLPSPHLCSPKDQQILENESIMEPRHKRMKKISF